MVRESWISTTRNIVDAIEPDRGRDVVLFSTSAVGYYGFHGDEVLTEESPAGDDFLAQVAIEWEKEALRAEQKGTRVVITRFGIVLGEKGGALNQLMSLPQSYQKRGAGTGPWKGHAPAFILTRARIYGETPPQGNSVPRT